VQWLVQWLVWWLAQWAVLPEVPPQVAQVAQVVEAEAGAQVESLRWSLARSACLLHQGLP